MPQSRSRVDDPVIYTMRELSQETSRIIWEINETGRSAAVTRRGRFVALITPLADAGVESAALSAAVDAAPDRAQLLGEEQADSVHTADQVAADLDIAAPRGD